jgi:Spy/CpxP family protein refolding chaperone
MIMGIASAVVLTMTSVQAQDVGSMGGMGSGGFGGRHHGQQQKNAKATPKADEKAYKAALKGIPDKPYDPWHGVH